MPLDSMQALLEKELRDIYSAETQMLKALPNMVKAAATPALKQALEKHLGETGEQVLRLEQSFRELGLPARGEHCRGMEGLLQEAADMMDEEGPDPVVDAGLIGAAQRVEHYEMAAYGSALALAELLGKDRIAAFLRASLEEERAADQALTALAQHEVNDTALAAGTRISES